MPKDGLNAVEFRACMIHGTHSFTWRLLFIHIQILKRIFLVEEGSLTSNKSTDRK